MAKKDRKANVTANVVPVGRRPNRFALECGFSRPTLDRLLNRLPAELRPKSLKLGMAHSSPRIIIEAPQEWLARVAAAQQATQAA